MGGSDHSCRVVQGKVQYCPLFLLYFRTEEFFSSLFAIQPSAVGRHETARIVFSSWFDFRFCLYKNQRRTVVYLLDAGRAQAGYAYP